jgi:hypothetical protein
MFEGKELTRCVGNYFVRAFTDMQEDPDWCTKIISIERRVLGKTIGVPDWENSTTIIQSGLAISKKKGTGIEDFRDSYQVNFADPYPGGTLPSPHGRSHYC